MKNVLIKYVRTGNGFKERLHVKAFKDSDSMYKFLNDRDNSLSWKTIGENEVRGIWGKYPEKSGVYAFAGGNWHNVKNLDPLTLAHV